MLWGPVITSVATGMASVSNLVMTGGSVPSGRRFRMALTLSRTSWMASALGRSSTNCTVTEDTPSRLTLRSSSMPEQVLTASSMGLVIWASISSGLAPRRIVLTVTVGRSTLGMRSTPSLR